MAAPQSFSRRAICLSPPTTSGDGVRSLRCYLKHYGYNLQDEDTSKATFDDDLKASLKRFQRYCDLPTSGKLDGPTKALLTQSRCGVPDATATASLEANIAVPWRTKTLKYYFGYPSNDVWQELCWAAVRRAFDTWEAAGVGLDFIPVQHANQANISIHWGPAADPHHSMIGNVLAHADFPPGASSTPGHPRDRLPLHFDDSEHVWVNGAVPGGFDIETVAIHEIGHCLGL